MIISVSAKKENHVSALRGAKVKINLMQRFFLYRKFIMPIVTIQGKTIAIQDISVIEVGLQITSWAQLNKFASVFPYSMRKESIGVITNEEGK